MACVPLLSHDGGDDRLKFPDVAFVLRSNERCDHAVKYFGDVHEVFLPFLRELNELLSDRQLRPTQFTQTTIVTVSR